MNKMIKTAGLLAICLILLLALSACGTGNKIIAGVTGSTQTCVDGVAYLQFPSGVTVAYNRDGSIKLCE